MAMAKRQQRRRKVNCQEHGDSRPWVICRHLREGQRLGYHRVEPDPDFEPTTVMCNACARILLAEDAWNDRVGEFADWTIYCEKCWKRERRRRGHRMVCRGRCKSV
ncbi:MAG TPA: hypothetical protein VFB96_09680 [Pirellulaceae bacterium]|nr:hypothetical protein [Pirellulaceae bacterium]